MINKRFWLAVATHIGSTVGVGLYGIPFAFQKAGFGVGFLYLVGLVFLVMLTNLLYGEIILRTHERHQYIGYVDKYLNPFIRRVNLFIFWTAIYGALISAAIIVGEFLSNVLSSVVILSPSSFSFIFMAAASILVFMGLRTVSKIDIAVFIFYLFIIFSIGIVGADNISLDNFKLTTGNFWFLPFGVILFAMASIIGIPLVREVLVGQEGLLKKALIFGTIAPALLYIFFAFLVVGISGEATTPDAVSGLFNILGPKIVWLASLFGFFTSSTLFMNLSVALKESFQRDFYFKHHLAWLLVVLPPLGLFLTGVRNFIDILGLVGGVGIGMKMFFSVLVYVRARKYGDRVPEYSLNLPRPILYLMMAIFLFGAVYTVLSR